MKPFTGEVKISLGSLRRALLEEFSQISPASFLHVKAHCFVKKTAAVAFFRHLVNEIDGIFGECYINSFSSNYFRHNNATIHTWDVYVKARYQQRNHASRSHGRLGQGDPSIKNVVIGRDRIIFPIAQIPSSTPGCLLESFSK